MQKGHHLTVDGLKEPAWERQPMEGERQYSQFRLFRDMPARQKRAVARHFGVSERTVAETAKAKLWDERVQRYDAHLETVALAVTERQVRSDAARNQQRIGEVIEEEYKLWKAGMAKVQELLAEPPDPRTAHQAAANLLRELSRIGRLAVGLHTEGGKAERGDDRTRDSDLEAFLDSLAGGEAPPAESEVPPVPPMPPAVHDASE